MTQVAEPDISTRSEPSRINHWIGGRLVEGTSGRHGEVFDPAAGRVAKHVDFASVDEVDAAVAAAIAETGATSAKDVGKVMKAVMPKLAGKNADGRTINEAVRRKLGV